MKIVDKVQTKYNEYVYEMTEINIYVLWLDIYVLCSCDNIHDVWNSICNMLCKQHV